VSIYSNTETSLAMSTLVTGAELSGLAISAPPKSPAIGSDLEIVSVRVKVRFSLLVM